LAGVAIAAGGPCVGTAFSLAFIVGTAAGGQDERDEEEKRESEE
jgi:hypothetical protein